MIRQNIVRPSRHRLTRRARLLLAIAGTLLSVGCKVGPDYQAPQMPVPADWVNPNGQPTTAPATQPSMANSQAGQLEQWWTVFNDATLNSLIQRAVESNLDLRQAEARLWQARASRGVTAAGLWPGVDTSAAYRRARASGGKAQNLYQAGFDASWELDVFGGIQRGIESADANIIAAVEDRRDVLVTVLAEVARNYIDLRGTQRRIVIANDNLASQRRSAELTRRRFQGGFVSRLDVANADALVATTYSLIPLLEQAAQQSIYSLSLLLGRDPGALLEELSPTTAIPTTPPEIPIGLPSDLLRRRPDIRRAEAQVHAATANIGVATSDLFPKFSLTGSVGVSANTLKALGNWDSRTYSVGPGVTWNIFDAGRIRSNIQVSNALTEQALIAYEKTVLMALGDVQSALVAYAQEQRHRSALADAVAANRQAVDLSTQLYTQGQTDFLNVLSAQRSLSLAEDALVQSNQNVAGNLVALYKALGGGWEESPAPTTQPAKQ